MTQVKISKDYARFIMRWHNEASVGLGYRESSSRIAAYMARILKYKTCRKCGNLFSGKRCHEFHW
jgi:hypothetical protein